MKTISYIIRDSKFELLQEYYDYNVPQEVIDNFNRYEDNSKAIFEFLKSIPINKMVSIIKNEFNVKDVNTEANIIEIIFNDINDRKSITNTIKFKYILSFTNYRIHTSKSNYVILEQSYPLNKYNKFIYNDCHNVVWHITKKTNLNSIENKGVKAKYASKETNEHFKLKMDASNYNNHPKVYFLATDNLNKDNIKKIFNDSCIKLNVNKDDCIICKIMLGKGNLEFDVYKDELMFDEYSFWTYNNIPVENIKAIYDSDMKLIKRF